MKLRRWTVLGLLCLNSTYLEPALAQQTKRMFTVSDDIGFTLIGGVYQEGAIEFSPDGRYLGVWSERERLDIRGPEDRLQFYRTAEVVKFLDSAGESKRPEPAWEVSLASDNHGQIIRDWRWLADSSGVTFLQRMRGGNQRLVLGDLQKKTLIPIVSETETKTVTVFDVADRRHYLYKVAELAGQEELAKRSNTEEQAAQVVGTDQALFPLLAPRDSRVGHYWVPRRSRLVAVEGDKTFEVKTADGREIPNDQFSLAPDGNTFVTNMPVAEVPAAWEGLYPPPFPGDRDNHIHPGHASGVSQFVLIDARSGKISPLVDAPTANDAGWWWGANGGPQWSRDGQAILLPGTFLKSKEGRPSRPCVAVTELASKTSTCVEELKARYEKGAESGYHAVMYASFVNGNQHRVKITYIDHFDESYQVTEYAKREDGWEIVENRREEVEAEYGDLQVRVEQNFHKPPLLVAINEKTNVSTALWDPNPQLARIELGDAKLYKWKDKEGRIWRGGLYMPVDYKLGQRYPLVIQDHGFADQYFLPHGVFPTAFAARELAAQGVMVLQAEAAPEWCHFNTEEEVPCAVAGYEAGVKQLVTDGLVDEARVGIIGFSRTCLYAMKALVTESFPLRAASVTDGVMGDYWQFILTTDDLGSRLIGAKPIGEGLQSWFKNSPAFSLEKANAPLAVFGEGPASLLYMWQPYAMLHYLHKPVDLIMLNTDEHVLTNPAVRYASQQGSVDWFRFWLQGYEDPDPSKVDQYKRWRGLAQMQKENEAKGKAALSLSQRPH